MTTRCPSCAHPLYHPPIADHTKQTAPWLCQHEHLGFWNAELTPEARKIYRPQFRDWGYDAAWLREAVRRERQS